MATENNCKELISRSAKMFDARLPTLNLWQELADQFYPERGEFTRTRLQEGFADHLFATEPVKMRRDLGNALSAMTRPGSRQWGKPDIDDATLRKDVNVRAYLDWLGATQWRHMYEPKAGFVRATKEADHDLVTFGNAVLSVEPNLTVGRLLYTTHHLKDCSWADDHEGTPNLMHRKMRMQARNIKSKFSQPHDKLDRKIIEACEKDGSQEFDLLHIMMPAADYEYVTRDKPKIKAPFVSIYLDVSNGCIIREAPSYEFRYIVQRWTTMPGSPYAISPATITALPDARMMQVLSRIIMEAGEKSVDPPVAFVQEGIQGEVNLYAGGLTAKDREYDERTGLAIEPIMLGKDAGLGLNMFDRLRAGMTEAFYLNKLNIPQKEGNPLTAFETAQIVEENLRASAPLFEPMEINNAAILDTTFEILSRVGAFGPPDSVPQALRGRKFSFTFSNPLHDAIERAKVMQFQGMTQLMAMAAQIDPSISADADMREAFRDAVQGSGSPATWLRSREDADEMAEGIAQEQEMAKGLAAAEVGGQAAAHVGKAVQALTPQQKKAA